ncbi:hypothetical protein AVEN_113840-1 [Araneus ventricosus]|uniref:Uncharacterized protein n=1 Tax=Araneus ventricosus TaxID=182803 RepID=A0A4Y2JBK8_ARAVE|nr:hypothetical protein AVEN_113840-1 [Araneus ventricosus]
MMPAKIITRRLLHLSPTWSCSLELKAGIKLSGSFHRSITGISVLDQVAVYQLTAADATKQLLLASLVGISEGTQAHGPDIALLIFGDHQQQQQSPADAIAASFSDVEEEIVNLWYYRME